MSQSKLRLSEKDEGLELSREDFAEADFDPRWRFERADGRLVVMVPPGHDHHATSEPFRDQLVVYKLAHRDLIEHVFEEAWTTVSEDTDRLPDIAVYLRGTPGPRRIPERVPDLVFEIVSESRRDRQRDYVEKRDEFERLGVREYVIVDRFDHKLTVLRLEGGAYVETVLGPDDAYTTPLLPGLQVALSGVI